MTVAEAIGEVDALRYPSGFLRSRGNQFQGLCNCSASALQTQPAVHTPVPVFLWFACLL